MHRPAFGASTSKDRTVYLIDYDTSEEDGEGETSRMSIASPLPTSLVSPLADSVVPVEPFSGQSRHAFAETLPLSSRR